MYKVTKAFIYRARLYPIGRELTEREYERMMRDKVAIKRGIPDKVASLGSPSPLPSVQKEEKKAVAVAKESVKEPAKAPVKRPANKTVKKPVKKTVQKPTQKTQKMVKPKEPATSAKKPASAKKKSTTAKKPATAGKKPVRKKQSTAKPKEE